MNQEAVRDTGSQDIAGIVSRFRRHIPISLAIIALMVVLAGVATMFMTPTYSATTQLVYAPQPALARNGQTSPERVSDAERDAAIDSQLQIVMSLPVAQRALQNAEVRNNPQIRKVALSLDPSGKSEEALASALLSSVTAVRTGQTAMFGISYTDIDSVKAAKIANIVAKSYIAVQSEQKLELAGAASADQLTKQVELLRQQAQAADAAVADFRLSHKLLIDPNATTPLPPTQLNDITTQLSLARGDAAQANARGSASGSTVVSTGIDTSAMSRLREQRAEAARDLAETSSRYGDRNPQVIDARERVAALDSAIRKEMSNLSSSARAESQAANARVSAIAGSLAQTQGKISADVRASVELADLQRKADAAHLLYANLLTTAGQQTANSVLIQPDAQITTPAVPPLKPTSPKLLINLLVGFVIGAAIALALAYLRERWSQTLNTIDDIDRLLGVQFLNSVPTLQSSIDKPKTRDPAAAVMQHPFSSYSEAFRSLATTLIFNARGADTPGGRVIGISSALPREGKTTTTISMARVLAMASTKVVVIDADLRRRSVSQAVAPHVKKGWIDVLNGDTTIEQAMFDDESGAKFLPIAAGAEKAQRVFEGDGFADLIAYLRQHYEVILVDTAPVLAVVDTRMILKHFDSLALLAHWRQTPVKAIRAALHQIETVGGSVAGVAMTMVNLKTQAQSGYGDASYYYNEMKDYYVSN